MAVPEEILAARPWIAHYPAGVPAEIAPESRMSLVDLWRRSRSLYGDRTALESFGVAPDLRAAWAAADKVAAWLQEAGFTKGDRVAIMAPNVMAYPAIMLGILQAGGWWSTSTRSTPRGSWSSSSSTPRRAFCSCWRFRRDRGRRP